MLHPPQAGTNVVACSTCHWTIGEHLAARLQTVDVADSLVLTPRAKRVRRDGEQVGFGTPRESESGHSLAGRWGKLQGLSNARENILPGNAAGVALVNRGAQRG